MLSGTFFVRNIKNSAKLAYSSQVFKWTCQKALPSYEWVKSVKMAHLSTAITFFWCRQFPIRKVLQKCVWMLYLVCENGLKIPVGTCFIDLQGKPVQKSAATLAAARIAGWGSCSTLLSTPIAAHRCDRFSIWGRLCYWGPFCKKYQKFSQIGAV